MSSSRCAIRGCRIPTVGAVCDRHMDVSSRCAKCRRWFTNKVLTRHGGNCLRCFDMDMYKRGVSMYPSWKSVREIGNQFRFYEDLGELPKNKEERKEEREYVRIHEYEHVHEYERREERREERRGEYNEIFEENEYL